MTTDFLQTIGHILLYDVSYRSRNSLSKSSTECSVSGDDRSRLGCFALQKPFISLLIALKIMVLIIKHIVLQHSTVTFTSNKTRNQ